MPKDFKPKQGSGDEGLTDLVGRRVPKTHRRVKLNALLDDLSALLGLLKSGTRDRRSREELSTAQRGLVRTAGVIAGLKSDLGAETAVLEALTARLSEKIKPPREFVLPGAGELEALAHLARARARLCELLAWELKENQPAVYLNRLSDYLFLAALKNAPKK